MTIWLNYIAGRAGNHFTWDEEASPPVTNITLHETFLAFILLIPNAG